MRAAIVIAALCVAYTVIAMTFRAPPGPEINAAGLAIALAFYPALILSGLLLLFGLFRFADRQSRTAAAFLILLSLPMPVMAASQVVSQLNRKRSSAWPGLAMALGDHLLDYHEKRPSAFEYLGDDEEVSVAGFGDYLAELNLEGGVSPAARRMRISGGEVRDPWGKPVRFALDRDHDGYISIGGGKVNTYHMNPPNLEYQVAVAVFLSHLDNGDIRPLVRRR